VVPDIYVSMFDIPMQQALIFNSFVSISIFILPIILRQTIDSVGRRPPVILGTCIGGLALLGLLVAPRDGWVLVVALMCIGQIGISVGSMILWPYTAEAFSTRVRSVALGIASSTARAASMLTPLVVGGIMQLTGSVTLVFLLSGSLALVVTLLWWRGTAETAGREIG
jgi:MFS transporter, putative metabolite:H+ symporter